MMTAETKFVLMKMKCVLEPILSIPMGQVWDEMIEPMELPDAAMFNPRALKLVGKISEPYTQAAGPKPIEYPKVYIKMKKMQT